MNSKDDLHANLRTRESVGVIISIGTERHMGPLSRLAIKVTEPKCFNGVQTFYKINFFVTVSYM